MSWQEIANKIDLSLHMSAVYIYGTWRSNRNAEAWRLINISSGGSLLGSHFVHSAKGRTRGHCFLSTERENKGWYRHLTRYRIGSARKSNRKKKTELFLPRPLQIVIFIPEYIVFIIPVSIYALSARTGNSLDGDWYNPSPPQEKPTLVPFTSLLNIEHNRHESEYVSHWSSFKLP